MRFDFGLIHIPGFSGLVSICLIRTRAIESSCIKEHTAWRDDILAHSKTLLEDPLAAMKNLFLLLIAVFVTGLAPIAPQPQSSASMAGKTTAVAEDGAAAAPAKEASFNGASWWNYVKVLGL